MSKHIQVLYTIFELELAPPFEVVNDSYHVKDFYIYNKHSEDVGGYDSDKEAFYIGTQFSRKDKSILNRIKKTFNVDKLSDDDVYYILKHLKNWLQGHLSVDINSIFIKNMDTDEFVSFESDDINHE